MSQEKAQLIAPIGIMTVTGVTATGVITATSFSGNIAGVAKSLVNGSDISTGVITATSFVGNLTGNILRLADSAPDINVGVSTATSFVGNLTGSVTDLTDAPAITVGMVTATTLEGPVTGNVTGNVSGLAGGLGVNYNGGWTGAGTSQINAGVVTATVFHGDGQYLAGVSGGPVSQQAVTIDGASTSIDLSNGNLIYASQSANTTVSFANSENGNVYFVRVKDANNTARTITWPDRINWNGGSAPTLNQSSAVGPDPQIFLLVTRDEGVTWYGDEVFNLDRALQLWTWGDNTTGRLGHNQKSPTGLSSPTQVAGAYSSLHSTGADNAQFLIFSKTSGDLWACGQSYEGAFGLNNISYYSSPVQLPGTTWNYVTASSNMIIGTKTNGELWTCGDNVYGGLGNNNAKVSHPGPYQSRSSPIQLPGTNWSVGATGQGAGYAIKTDGTLWAWGNNQQYGGLGLNESGPGTNYSSPTQVGTNTTWTRFASGAGASGRMGAIKSDGTIWTWGENGSGELGLNNTTDQSSPTQVGTNTNWSNFSTDSAGCIGTKTDGTLWVWGGNDFGSLGLNDAVKRSSPTQLGTGTDWNIAQHNARSGYTYAALKTDGTLWAWGLNHKGEFGLNDRTNRSSPTQIPSGSGTWTAFDLSGWNGCIAAIKST